MATKQKTTTTRKRKSAPSASTTKTAKTTKSTRKKKQEETLQRKKEEEIKVPDRYWNKKGKYQKEYNQAWKHVPKMGPVENNADLDLLRVLSKYYYDINNNGLCNQECYQADVVAALQKFQEKLIETGETSLGDIHSVAELDYKDVSADFARHNEEDSWHNLFSWELSLERVLNACVLIGFRSIQSVKKD